jgi:ABC-type lipoprotein export system ATPase subunit
MITMEEVTKVYELGRGSSISAVRGVTLKINSGEFVVVVGRSGSGKTSLLNLAAGLTRPTSGRVSLDGVNLWRLSDQQRAYMRNRIIGFVFQQPTLSSRLTVLGNVVLPTRFAANRYGLDVRERAAAMLRIVGLSDRLDAYPRHLSAGQLQRAVIAQALVNRPQLLLADEPTSNLDEMTEMELIGLLREVHAAFGLTIVLVSHTKQIVAPGMRLVEMAGGRIVTEPEVYAAEPMLHYAELVA